MIFQKRSSPVSVENNLAELEANDTRTVDDVETVVGPSVNVEGDFASEGNIVVKGSVAGSVRTSKHLSVEQGAKILANVRAGSAQVAGEVRGNMKIKDILELASTARVVGDVEVKTLTMEAGALVYGKIMMPGLEVTDKAGRGTKNGQGKKSESEEQTVV
ncbi:MAG: polymer-forming cytoskeletal protein [Candidatus Magasanikbacteria bacterium]|nr:polymer-forming cytoskeletal protein [Candidatus Magasanikbacteria bacterium]